MKNIICIPENLFDVFVPISVQFPQILQQMRRWRLKALGRIRKPFWMISRYVHAHIVTPTGTLEYFSGYMRFFFMFI